MSESRKKELRKLSQKRRSSKQSEIFLTSILLFTVDSQAKFRKSYYLNYHYQSSSDSQDLNSLKLGVHWVSRVLTRADVNLINYNCCRFSTFPWPGHCEVTARTGSHNISLCDVKWYEDIIYLIVNFNERIEFNIWSPSAELGQVRHLSCIQVTSHEAYSYSFTILFSSVLVLTRDPLSLILGRVEWQYNVEFNIYLCS